VLHQEHRYMAAARNNGIRHARGEFILPLDCDDTLDPSFLAETLPLLREAPSDVGFVFTHMRVTQALSGVLSRHFNRFDQLFLNQLPYCMLLRRSAWEAVGGYDESMRVFGSEDWEFNIHLARAGFRGMEIPKPLFVYRISSEGMLMSHAVRRQGSIWRYIREKHADLYRLPALAELWWATRSSRSRISLFTAAGLLAMAVLLPESWFNRMYHRMFILSRSRRLARGELQPAS
jgi:glycosyltransferase involved in cell wall biosynthesis